MSSINLSALLISLSAVSKAARAFKKVAPSSSMKKKIARASRKAQQRLARAERRARQFKNGWLRSPAYQLLCREADHASRISQTPPPTAGGEAKAGNSRPVVKYSRLSDGQGEYNVIKAVRVHRAVVAPRTRVERVRESIERGAAQLLKMGRPRTRAEKRAEKARKQRQQWREQGVLDTSPEVKLPKLDRKERKLRKQLAALAVSPVARPRDINRAQEQLQEVTAKAAKLSEEVKAASDKKKEQRKEEVTSQSSSRLEAAAAKCERLKQKYYSSQGEEDYIAYKEAVEDYQWLKGEPEVETVSDKKKEQRKENSVQEEVIEDDFLALLELLKSQLDANLAPIVPESFAEAAAKIVGEHKAQAEATGTEGMTMMLTLSCTKDAGGNEVNVINVVGSWSGEQIDRILPSATKNVMVNLVGKTNLQKSEFTKRGFVLVDAEWYCLSLEQNKQLIKEETPVRPPITPRAVPKAPKLVKTRRGDGVDYLHLYPNKVTPKSLKELLAEPQKLDVLVNISCSELMVDNRDGFIEFLRDNGFENYSCHTDWLVLPAGKLFAEPKGESVEEILMEVNISSLPLATLKTAGSIRANFKDSLEKAYKELALGKYGLSLETFTYLREGEEEHDWAAMFVYITTLDGRENTVYNCETEFEEYNLSIAEYMAIEERLVKQMFSSQGFNIQAAAVDCEKILAEKHLSYKTYMTDLTRHTVASPKTKLLYSLEKLVEFAQGAGASETLQKAIKGEPNNGSLTEVDKAILSSVNTKLCKTEKITPAMVKRGDSAIAQWIDYVADKYGVDTISAKPVAETKVEAAPRVVASLTPYSYEPFIETVHCLELKITIDGEDVQHVLTIHDDEEDSYEQAEKLGLLDSLKSEVTKVVGQANKEVHFFYDTHCPPVLLHVLEELGFSDYDSTSDSWMVKRVAELPEADSKTVEQTPSSPVEGGEKVNPGSRPQPRMVEVQSTGASHLIIGGETYAEDGIYYSPQVFLPETKELIIKALQTILDSGAAQITSFGPYSYTCLGDYYWTWNKKGKYSTTQPNGSAVTAIPELLKEIVETWLNGDLKVWEGHYVVESCLVNFYKGKQHLNCHQDKTEEVDAPIVSISFGAAGRFLIHEGGRAGRVSHEFTLSDSDLLVMYGKHRYCWHEYAGNILEGERVNLTFRMVKKPAVKQQEVRTVSQNQGTVATPIAENKAVGQEKQTLVVQERPKVNTNFKPQPRAKSLPLPELLPQSEVGRISGVPEGCSHIFDFRTSEAKNGLSEVIVAAFSVMADEKGDIVPCNINTPSNAYNDDYVHYGLEDTLTTKKGENMNVLSLIASTTKSLDWSLTPCVLSVGKHCINGVREEFVPTAYYSADGLEQQANFQIILVQPGGESALTDQNAIPGVEGESRKKIRGAVLKGNSKTIKSLLSITDKKTKVEEEIETSVTINFRGDGLESLLADGKRHTFIVVAWYDKAKQKFFNEGGKQYRFYPHTASVFHVDDLAAVFGGNMFKFDVRTLLGLAAAPKVKAEPVVAASTTEVVRPTRPLLVKPEESAVKEVQESINKANLALELAELHKHTRLKGLTLTKGLSREDAQDLLKGKLSPDGLTAHRTLSHIKSRTNGKPVQLFDWSKADVLKVAQLFHDLISEDKATADQEVFCYREVEEGLLLSFDSRTIEFLISDDGRAYNYADGRAFEQGMELIGYNDHNVSWWDSAEYDQVIAKFKQLGLEKALEKIEEEPYTVSAWYLVNGQAQSRDIYTPVITDVCFASSIGKFMQAFCAYLLMFAQSKNNTRGGLGDNFKMLLNKCESVISMTEGDILGQNGGFLYSVQNSPKLYVHREQCDIYALHDDKVAELAGSVAAVVKGYEVKPPKEMLRTSSTETQSLAMKVAFEKYPALGFHFAKGIFINGLTHLRLATLQQHAPTLFNKTLLLTGLDVEAAVNSVVSLTLKASKGAKRATLALARAVEVEGEVKAGWAFYGQEKVLTGWLVQECMAPTFVMAPGMSFFLGTEAEKPVAIVKKTQTEKYSKFLATNVAGAVSMTGVTEHMKCFADFSPTQTFDEPSATHRITFDREVKLLKGTQIAFVKKEEGQGPDAVITFNQNEVALLNDITWRVNKDLQGKQVLEVNYSYTLHHRNPKLRGVIKTMMGSCNKELLYNCFNDQKLAALGLNDIKLVAPQDTIKSDMLYSWLMVIGNTIRHNDPTNKHIAELIRLRDKLNQDMMGGAEYDPDTIVINPAAVVAGLYSELISYFTKHFGHSLWMHVQQPGDQGEIINRLYDDRVAQNAGWVAIPETAWGEYEKAWAVSRRKQGFTVKLYAESVDYLNNDKQNALLFTLDADEVVVEYLHRSFCYVGAKGAPVYGVELFESSTVAEAISDSRHMSPSVRSLSRMEGVAFDDAWALLNAGKEKMFMSLVIAGMSSLDKFGCSKTVTILERGDKKDKNLILSAEDKVFLNSILAENSINLEYHEVDQFKTVAHAFRDIVFVVAGKTFWLPALSAINSLKSESSSNNLAQQFFREILVECLAGRNVPAIEGSRAAGILDSLCDSASTKKLITAAGNMSAKRIALPHIPAGEIHILKSTHPASNYQNLLRNGFKLKEVEAGKSTIFVHNSRAPLTDGSLLKLVIVTEAENKENFWKLDSDSFALGSMGNGMDFGDFDGDGHYFVQLVGTDYTVSTFESVAEFISDAVGYDIFNTYANPENKEGDANEAYLADHYNIKKWSKVDETLCKMAVKKATKPSATYLMYNQNAREMQAKATGIAYSVYMWSEHLVDILLAYKKLSGALPLGFDAAADGSLVAPISQVYEVILGGFSDPAWAVYTKYFLKMKEGERTVFDSNLAEFNKDLMAMGVTGQKRAGFSALMFASYHLFFLEKWGAFNDYETDAVTKNPLPLEIKGMLACALVSFELMRGKFQGFTGALAVEKGSKVTGHTVAMEYARTFLSNNPGMVSQSLVCKQLAQTIEVCNHLLAGMPRPERSLATHGIQERSVIVATSNLSDEALQHFLTKVGALAEVKADEPGDEGGSEVAVVPNTPDSGDGGAAVEPIDYNAYQVVDPLGSNNLLIEKEYYSQEEIDWLAATKKKVVWSCSDIIVVPGEDEFCLSSYFLGEQELYELSNNNDGVVFFQVTENNFVLFVDLDHLNQSEISTGVNENILNYAENFGASESTTEMFLREVLTLKGRFVAPKVEEDSSTQLSLFEAEEPVFAGSAVVDEYYSESELEQKRAEKSIKPELQDLDILDLEKLVPEGISNNVIEYVESEEEHKACLVYYLEANGYVATPVKLTLREKLEKLLSNREARVLDTFVSRLGIDTTNKHDFAQEDTDTEEFAVQLAAHLASPDWHQYYNGNIADFAKTVLDSIDPPVAPVKPPVEFVEFVKSKAFEKPVEVVTAQTYIEKLINKISFDWYFQSGKDYGVERPCQTIDEEVKLTEYEAYDLEKYLQGEWYEILEITPAVEVLAALWETGQILITPDVWSHVEELEENPRMTWKEYKKLVLDFWNKDRYLPIFCFTSSTPSLLNLEDCIFGEFIVNLRGLNRLSEFYSEAVKNSLGSITSFENYDKIEGFTFLKSVRPSLLRLGLHEPTWITKDVYYSSIVKEFNKREAEGEEYYSESELEEIEELEGQEFTVPSVATAKQEDEPVGTEASEGFKAESSLDVEEIAKELFDNLPVYSDEESIVDAISREFDSYNSNERLIDSAAFKEATEVLAEQVKQPVQSEVTDGKKQKMATLMKVVEQLPESSLDKLLEEAEKLLAELTKAKEPAIQVNAVTTEKPVREILKADPKEETADRAAGVYKELDADEAPSIPRPEGGTQKQLLVIPTSNKTAKPESTNSSSRKILPPVADVKEVKAEVTKAHPLDGLAPLSPSTAKPMIKDIAMAAVATQFIGTSAVSKPSSTELYRQAWAEWKGGCANTGVYTYKDVVMVSGNGSFRATEAQIAETFTKSYVPYLILVVNAKATVVVGNCSGMDCLVRDYLVEAGYQKTWVEAKVGGYNRLTPPSKPKRKVLSKEVKQPAEASVTQTEGDWIDALVCKLESWIANQIRKALATLSSEQLEAARIIIQHAQNNTTARVAELDPKDVITGHVLTGKAGTGKTHATCVIIKVLDLLGFRVVACSTTGLASQNLNGSSGTINRVLNLLDGFERKKDANGKLLPLTQADISAIVTRMVKGGRVAKRLSEQSDSKTYLGVILLVDEAFMLGGHLAVAAAAGIEAITATEAKKGVVRKRPVQLLLVGDPKQFEPVKDVLLCEETQFLDRAGDEKPVAHPSFTDYMNLKTIKLLKNERQSGDSAFGDELDLLGEGRADKDLSNCPIIRKRFKESLTSQPADALHIIFNKEETALFNRQKLEELIKKTGAVKRVYRAVISKDKYESVEKLLSDISPTPEFLELVVGVPVRVTQNVPKNDGTDDNKVANGERGVVVHLSKDKVTVKFNDGRVEELEAVELDKKLSKDENGAPMGQFKQIPLCLCWATTFHGSQGQTYPKGEPVIVHMYSRQDPRDPNSKLRPVPANNAFYVACSRVTRSEDLFFYTGLGVDEKPEGLTDEQFVDYRRNTYLGHFKASYKYNKAALAWLEQQSC